MHLISVTMQFSIFPKRFLTPNHSLKKLTPITNFPLKSKISDPPIRFFPKFLTPPILEGTFHAIFTS